MPIITSFVCRSRTASILSAAAVSMLLVPVAQAEIHFEDVSAQTNMTGFTEGWGASVGDGNGDNCPDLYVNGHRDYPRYYRNTCDGSFEDIAYELDPGNWIAKPTDDKHGAAWADFDSDGDEDLLQSVATTGNAQLLVNENGVFIDRASEAGLASDSRGRMPVWFDYSGDGYLDVAQLGIRDSFLRAQAPPPGLGFIDDKSGTGFSCPDRVDWAQLIDVNNDGSLELICAKVSSFPLRVYDVSSRLFVNVTSSIPGVPLVNDSVAADFNNDLLYDLILTRGLQRPSGTTQVTPHRIESWLRTGPVSPPDKGFMFSAPGEITVTLDHSGMRLRDDSRVFVLDSNSNSSLSDGPIDIDFDPVQQRWVVVIRNDGGGQAYVQIDTVAVVTNFVETGIQVSEGPLELYHLVNSPSGMFFDFSTGLTEPITCVSGVAGDFNNDMWVDLYLVCRDGVDNIANRLYENQGNGIFQLASNHGGEGPVGTGFEFGVGESVVVFDYDGDGRLDLYVNNGLLFYPVHVGGPDTMLRNTTSNGNHWIEIDLRGTGSNRDGVGARVFLTAGGVQQLRVQDGGYHRVSQNHQRLHFGLAGNQLADITIEWPSGIVDTYENVQADQLYEAVEGGPINEQAFGPPLHTELEAGDECGEPPYHFEYGPAVLMWRDCPGNVWHLRAKGGLESSMQLFTDGSISADIPFSSVSGHQLDSGDSFSSAGSVLAFYLRTWLRDDEGLNFDTAGQSSACFGLSRQDIDALIVGSSRKRIAYAFDLFSLTECVATLPPPSPPPPPPPSPPPPGDPECGLPLYDRASEPGIYAWRDCDHTGSEARWNFRVVAGGRVWDRYSGAVTSDVTLSATSPPLTGNDVVDSSPGDSEVDFQLWVGGRGEDSFQIDVPAGSQTCFAVAEMPPGTAVQIGAIRQVMTGSFDLLTLEGCAPPPPPPPPPGDPECGQPIYDRSSEPGFYIWRDCDYTGPEARWNFHAVGGGRIWDRYAGAVTSDVTLSATPDDGVNGNDVVDSSPGDAEVDFQLWVGGSGEDSFRIDVPAGSQTCFDMEAIPSGISVLMGAERQAMPGSFDLLTLEACTPPPPPTANPACGAPVFDRQTEAGVFIWRNCDASGPDAEWQVRFAAGGSGWSPYEGLVTSDQPLGATGVGLRSPDAFDSVPNDETVEFRLWSGGSGVDGFQLAVPAGAQTCFTMNELKPGAQVELGAGRQVMGLSFDLETLGSCN